MCYSSCDPYFNIHLRPITLAAILILRFTQEFNHVISTATDIRRALPVLKLRTCRNSRGSEKFLKIAFSGISRVAKVLNVLRSCTKNLRGYDS